MIYSNDPNRTDPIDLPGSALIRALYRKIARRIGLRSSAVVRPEPLKIEIPGLASAVTIVDIGASGGLHERWSRLPAVRSILVEPDARAAAALRTNDPAVVILETALSERRGDLKFHLCRKQMVSSVHAPNMAFLAKFPDATRFEILETISLTADTLENALTAKSISSVDFIKLDTQGHELAILKGSGPFLDTALGLEIEVEFAPMYADQPLFAELHGFVAARGFVLFDLRRHYWQRTTDAPPQTKGQLVFGDALYLRSPESVVQRGDADTVLRAYAVYMAYGYSDIALVLARLARERGLMPESVCTFLRAQASELCRDSPFLADHTIRMKNLVDSEKRRIALDSAVTAAIEAGLYLRGQSNMAVIDSSGRDVKMAADSHAENIILKSLGQYGEFNVLAEESGFVAGSAAAPCWIVDPLDGTVNYSRRIPLSAVSIGLWQSETPLLGVVNDFWRGDIYTGDCQAGAALNGQEIRVSGAVRASSAVALSGIPVGFDAGGQSIQSYLGSLEQFKKVRMLGSASLSLAFVASGRADVYFENGIALWDVAAGLALVQAAGGCIRVEPTASRFRCNVRAAATWELMEDFVV